MIQVDKKDGESNDSLMRRFTRKVQGSGVLILKKKRQFRTKKQNKRQRRESALMRNKRKAEREYLIKIGKIEVHSKFGARGNTKGRNKKKD